MDKAIATKESNLPAAAMTAGGWDIPTLSQRDVIIPMILLMQPMSPQVTDEKAAFGEFRESLNMEVLGKFDKGFQFVPFKMVKYFTEAIDNGEDENEWLRNVDITPQNENLPYNDLEMIEGKEVKIVRDRVMKFFVLLVKELEQGSSIPYTFAFKRSNYKAGQKLATQMFIKNINSGKTPASMVMEITCAKTTSDNKTWAVSDIKPIAQTENKYIAEAFRWLEIVNSGKAKEHDVEQSGLQGTSQGTSQGVSQVEAPSDDIPF